MVVECMPYAQWVGGWMGPKALENIIMERNSLHVFTVMKPYLVTLQNEMCVIDS